MQKILILDYHGLMYKIVFSAIKELPEDNYKFDFFKHQFLTYILNTIKNQEPNKVIIAIDSKNSWRYSIYPNYKLNRKARTWKLNDELFYPMIEEYTEDIKNLLSTVCFLKCDGCEGDDIIAILTKYHTNDQVTIITGDSDMNQLLSDNVKVFNIKNNEYVKCLNPKAELDVKILSGDTSDFIKPVRAGIGAVTAGKILDEGWDGYYIKKGLNEADKVLIQENIKLNTQLIDFNFIPIEIKNRIIDTYTTYEYKTIEVGTVKKFFAKYIQLLKLRETWQQVSNLLRSLGAF